MSIYNILDKVPLTAKPRHVNTLNRIVRVEAAVAAPTVWEDISNVLKVDIGEPSFGFTDNLLHQGGGYRGQKTNKEPIWTGSIEVYRGKLQTVLAQLFGIDLATQFGMGLLYNAELPEVHWESIIRDHDNKTMIEGLVIEDMVIKTPSISQPIDSANVTIPFITERRPWMLKTGYECVYDQWATDGIIVEFTCSSTAVNIADASNERHGEQFEFDEIASFKLKPSGFNTGYFYTDSNVTFGTNKFTFTSAPADAGTLQALYAKAVA